MKSNASGHWQSLTRVEQSAVVLAVVTGIVHLALGIGALPDPLGVAAILAAVGFGVGIVLYALDYRRRLVLALGVPFVAAQVALWYVLNEPSNLGEISPMAALDKPVQLALISLLIILYRRESHLRIDRNNR